MRARHVAAPAALLAALVGLVLLLHRQGAEEGAPGGAAIDRSHADESEPPTLRGLPPPEVAPPAPAPQDSGPGPVVARGRVSSTRPPTAERPSLSRLAEGSRDGLTGDLRVRVTDGTGHPREGVTLSLYVFVEGHAKKLRDLALGTGGEAEILSLAPGRVVAYFEVGDLKRRVSAEVVAGRVTELEVPLPPGAVLEGQVRHEVKGPLAGIRVSLGDRLVRSRDAWTDTLATETDAEGRYRFEEVPAGTWPVSLQGEVAGYHPRARAYVTVSGPGTYTQDFALGRIALRGTIRDARTGDALPSVRVALQDPLFVSTQTDAEGVYAFRDVPPGDYTLSLSKDGYGHRFVKTGAVSPEEVRAADFELEPAATLELVLLDAEEKPVPGEFVVSIRPAEGTEGTSLSTNLMADWRGRARYDRVVPGTYELGVRVKGYARASLSTEVGPGANTARFVLSREAATDEVVSLRGVVRDETDHRPLAGVRVTLQSPLHRTAMTDAQGTFRFADLPTGKAVLVVAKDGYGIRFIRGLEVKQGEERTTEVFLSPAATLHLFLVDGAGAPVVGRLTLGVVPLEDEKLTRVSTGVQADAEGHAVFRQILPGRYRLRLIQEGAGGAETEADVGPGENRVFARLE